MPASDDYACLRCPLPDCDEADPRCLLRQGREPFKKSKWSAVYEQIALLMPGEEDGVIVRRAEVRSLQRGISGQHCAGRLPKIETWREDAWGDSCRLCFRVVGEGAMARREARLTILSGDEGAEWLRHLLETLRALQFTVARIEFAEEGEAEEEAEGEAEGE